MDSHPTGAAASTGADAQAKRCSHCRVEKPLADFTRRCCIEGQRVAAFRKKLLTMAIYQRDAAELAERLERFKADNTAVFDAIAANPRGPYVRRSPHLLRRWSQR